jgi:hypothetical protein
MTTSTKTPALKTLRPARDFVNTLAGFAEFKFTGSLANNRLEKKISAFFAEMERRAPGSFTKAPQALWVYCAYEDKDCYTVRVVLRSSRAFSEAYTAFDRETRGF